jgi:NADH:ubiquinone oxidoreductase subunit 2 (subunit N)
MLTLAVVALLQGMYASSGNTFYGFGNMVVSDAMGNWLKCFATRRDGHLVYGRPYAADRDMLRGGELFMLSMLALLGMFIMISGNNFLVMYLGLELLTLSSYALVALRRDHATATEAAMKYFVLGAMASGFLLYGMSMLYGATGSLDIGQVFKAINSGEIKHQVLVFGLVFVVAGLAFKLGVVPFHMWVPDVYQVRPRHHTDDRWRAQAGCLCHDHPPAGGRPAAAGHRLAADADGAGRLLAAHRQPGRHRADQPQAHAGLLDHFPDGLCAAGSDVGVVDGR